MTRKILSLKNPPKIEILRETSFDRQQKCLEFLCETFPKCFSKRDPKPLKSNILHEIFERLGEKMTFSKSTLRQTIKMYCHNFHYLNSTLTITHRIGLEGEKADAITQIHREYAKEQLERLKKRKLSKKF